jgi:hypothetical protein
MKRFPLWLLLLLMLPALPGCVGGGGQGEISGVVKFQGKPLPGGTIAFYDPSGRAWPGAIDSDGKYNLKGVPTGTAQITVITPMAIAMPGAPPPPKVTPIPDKYGDPKKSGQTYEVRNGLQEHDVLLD